MYLVTEFSFFKTAITRCRTSRCSERPPAPPPARPSPPSHPSPTTWARTAWSSSSCPSSAATHLTASWRPPSPTSSPSWSDPAPAACRTAPPPHPAPCPQPLRTKCSRIRRPPHSWSKCWAATRQLLVSQAPALTATGK